MFGKHLYLDAEQSLLGSIMIDTAALNKVMDIVHVNDFCREDHRKIYQLILELRERNELINIMSVSNLAKEKDFIGDIGGITYLGSLMDGMTLPENISLFVKIMQENTALRKTILTGTKAIEPGDEVDAKHDEYINETGRMDNVSSFVSMKPILINSIKTIEQACDRTSSLTGIATGFIDFDKLTKGLQPCDLIIVAGDPSMGKTSFCLNIALNVALNKQNKGVGIFSLEMSKEQLTTRFLTSEAEVESVKLRTGVIEERDWALIRRAVSRLSNAPIYVDDSCGLSIAEVMARSRRLKKEHGIGLLIIDYLQLLRGRTMGEKRDQDLSEISLSLKILAKELKIPVIAVSQLSRFGRKRNKDRRPRLDDLTEFAALEQDADLIVFVYRDEVYNRVSEERRGLAEIIIGKQRNGATDTIILAFLDKFITFRDLYRE